MKKIYLFFMACMIVGSSFAAEHRRPNLVIKTWHPIASERPHAPEYNGLTRVYFTVKGSWGSSNCRDDAADISNDDQALYSSMLAAFMSGKTVEVEVSDTMDKVAGVCKMTAAFIAR